MRTLAGIAALLLLAACGSADEQAAPTPQPTPTPTATAPWPLTGLPSDGPVDGPVLVVKVDNTANASPQRGLDAADLVVEEVVEGGVTRLAVMVHSALPGADDLVVGPVRSVRSSDVGIVAPTQGVLVASGGAGPPVADLQAAGITTVFEDGPGFSRDPSRAAPYNLFVDLVDTRDSLPDDPAPPDYLEWAEDDGVALPPGEGAAGLLLRFSPSHTTQMDYDPATGWSRSGDDSGFTAGTVIALLVEESDAGYLDPAGNPVPVLLTTGSGAGWLAHAGTLVPIEWSKPDASQPWSFTTSEGDPLAVPPGRVYLALMPSGTASVTPVAPATE